MTDLLLLATSDGLVFCESDGDAWRGSHRGLVGCDVTAVIAREGIIQAGTTGGIYRSYDLGQTWSEASAGLSIQHVRWLAYHPGVSDLELAGTEPAGIFVSHAGGERWRACPEVATLRDAGGWYLPYSPEAGCVRGFAFHGSRAYAAVEVGGVLVSNDYGETWQLAEGCTGRGSLVLPRPPFIASDVHSIEIHPSSPDLVFAPTNNGLYRSEDGGKTWANLYRCYCRAVWIDPDDPEHILLGPADGVDANGRIEETRDGGHVWRRLATDDAAPWRGHMVERFAQAGDRLLVVLSNGELLAASRAGLGWEHILPGVVTVNAVTAIA